ncbi:MAG: hypothetical protein R3A45_08760 [Bdellovibrionota bacterium]
MPQQRKYNDEFRYECFDLYCDGHSFKQIADIMGVSRLVVKRLKIQAFPMNWEKGRTERVLKKTQILNKNALETYERILAIQQNLLMELSQKIADSLCTKAENLDIDDKVAMDGLLEAMREARRLYLPLTDQFMCNRGL